MRLHMPYAGYGNLQPLRHFGHTPGLYAYRGLPAFASLSLAGSVSRRKMAAEFASPIPQFQALRPALPLG